jgi:hypothetical protein
MFKKNKLILKHSTFFAGYPEVKPAKSFIPDWYRLDKNPERNLKNIKQLPHILNFRSCFPFFDSFTLGYMITLPVDIAIKQLTAGPQITWNEGVVDPLQMRVGNENSNVPIPRGCSSTHFIWQLINSIKIPKGYSALFCHPLNRYDLPFVSLSGVIDGEIALHRGNFPVFFSSTFEGIVKQGTPIIQIILFKTENWKSEIDINILAEADIGATNSKSVVFGWYKKNKWKKKIFE